MPSKRKRSKPIESRFLFVTENPSSARTTGFRFSSGRSKQSHVQRLYFERKKQAALGRASTEPPPEQGQPLPREDEERRASDNSEDLSTSNSVGSSQDETDAYEGGSNSLRETANSGIVFRRTAVHANRFQNHVDARLRKARLTSNRSNDGLPATIQRATSDTSILPASAPNDRALQRYKQDTPRDPALCFIPVVAGGYFDPFDSTVVIIDKWAHTLISYYMIVVIPSMFQADSRAIRAQLLNQSRHNSALFEDVQNCVSDKAHYYALLTAASSRMLRVEGKLLVPPNLQNSRAQGPEDFKALAMQALRSRLVDAQVDDLMVQDVYRLFAAEILVGNLEAAEIHFSALRRMVDAIGGVRELAPYTMERVILIDIFSGVQRLSPPRFELTWDPGPLPSCIDSKIRAFSADSFPVNLGQTLLKSAQSNDFHPTILTTIADLIPLSQAHLLIWQESQYSDSPLPSCDNSNPSTPPLYNAEGMHILLRRRTALEHRLLSLQDVDNSIQEAVRLALVLFVGMTFADPARRTITGKVRSKLQEKVMETDYQGELWWPQTCLLLWVCCVASLASEEVGDTKSWEWFGRVAASCRAAEGLCNLESVKEVLSGFFWLEKTHGRALESLFERFDGWMTDGDGGEISNAFGDKE